MSHHASFHRASRGRRAVLTHSHRRDGVTIGQVADHPHPTCGGQHPACIDAAPDAHLSGAAAARRSTERSRPHASRPRCKGEPSSWSGSRRLPLTVLIRLGMELGTAFEGARARLGPLRCVRSCRQVGVGEQMGTSTRSSHGHVSHNLECTVDLSKTRQRAHPAIPMRRVAYSVHSFLLERLGAKPQARVYCSVLIVHSPCNRLHLVIPARWLNGLGLATGCRGVGLLRGRGRQQGWHPRPASVALPPSRGGPDAGMGSFAWRRPTTRHQPAATMGCRWSGGAATALSGDLWLCGA